MFHFRGPSQVGDRLVLKAIVNNAFKNRWVPSKTAGCPQKDPPRPPPTAPCASPLLCPLPSMEVGVCAEAYDQEMSVSRRHINSAFMTFVVLDDEGRPRTLPMVVPQPGVRSKAHILSPNLSPPQCESQREGVTRLQPPAWFCTWVWGPKARISRCPASTNPAHPSSGQGVPGFPKFLLLVGSVSISDTPKWFSVSLQQDGASPFTPSLLNVFPQSCIPAPFPLTLLCFSRGSGRREEVQRSQRQEKDSAGPVSGKNTWGWREESGEPGAATPSTGERGHGLCRAVRGTVPPSCRKYVVSCKQNEVPLSVPWDQSNKVGSPRAAPPPAWGTSSP